MRGFSTETAGMKSSLIRAATLASFLLGAVLLALNVVGLATDLRNPAIYDEPLAWNPKGPQLTAAEVRARAPRLDGESDVDYLHRVHVVLSRAVAHYWSDEGRAAYNIRVPWSENYILHLAGLLQPSRYAMYEFYDFEKALDRGVGLCSQQSIVSSGLLERSGIETNIVGLFGHVVVAARVSGAEDEWWVFDPDYGVLIEHSVSEIEADPELIRPYYIEQGHAHETVSELVTIYGPEGNAMLPTARAYKGKNFFVEKAAYFLIWALPLLLLAPGPAVLIFERRRKA